MRSKDFVTKVTRIIQDSNVDKLRTVLQKASRPAKTVRHLTTALAECVRLDNDACLRVLLDCCTDVHPHTAFMTSCFKDVIAQRSSKCLDELLVRGYDVDARDEHGRTALHRAAIASDLEAFHMLLARGASVAVLDSNRQSPLQVNREVELRLHQIVNNFHADVTPEVSDVEPEASTRPPPDACSNSARQVRRSASFRHSYENSLRHFQDELRQHKRETESRLQELSDCMHGLRTLVQSALEKQVEFRIETRSAVYNLQQTMTKFNDAIAEERVQQQQQMTKLENHFALRLQTVEENSKHDQFSWLYHVEDRAIHMPMYLLSKSEKQPTQHAEDGSSIRSCSCK